MRNYNINVNWLKIDNLIDFGLYEGNCWAFAVEGINQIVIVVDYLLNWLNLIGM